ncbi:MAG: sugar-binding transcriptional regulator [Chloroflexi bacterium]|nr:sugar-binding transcriptional regulator [Chloroflexota bacterium]
MPKDADRLAYLAKIASLYYDQGQTQQEISEAIGVTRSAVSRLLTEARESGIVEVTVHYPWKRVVDLEQALKEAFQLKDARVLMRDERSYEDMLGGIGKLAAEYLEGILTPESIIGISWGSALYEMIRALPQKNYPNAEVVQLIGATGNENNPTDGPVLAQLLSQRLGSACRYLHAPLIVENKIIHEMLIHDRTIQSTLRRAHKATIALVGIGTTDPELSSLLRAGYLTEDELQRLQDEGAIGDICAHHYNERGEILDIDMNQRVIGISAADLKRVETVIGVAGGIKKTNTITGALRGKLINVLVTDEWAARGVLANARS